MSGGSARWDTAAGGIFTTHRVEGLLRVAAREAVEERAVGTSGDRRVRIERPCRSIATKVGFPPP
jgi:hypothetical protein